MFNKRVGFRLHFHDYSFYGVIYFPPLLFLISYKAPHRSRDMRGEAEWINTIMESTGGEET